MRPANIAWAVAILVIAAAMWFSCPADAADIRIEGGTIAALNSDCDLGLSVSVGAELPEWLPLVGGRIGFADLLTVGTEQAIGLSVSIHEAEADDGWRIGAVVTRPDEWPPRVTGYLRYGVAIEF